MSSSITSRKYTLEQLSTHNTEKSSLVTIRGVVYDITQFASMHPGGEEVIRMFSGKDVTDVFTTFHEKDAWAKLQKFRVGVLGDGLSNPEYVEEFRALNSKFRRMGLYEINHWMYYRLIAAIICMHTLFFYVMLSDYDYRLKLLISPLLPLTWMQSGFLGHDLGHNQMFKKTEYNEAVGFVLNTCLMGMCMDWWKSTHNTHHAVTNSIDLDPDTQYFPIFAVSSHLVKSFFSKYHKKMFVFDSLTKFFVTKQHYLLFPVMAFARVNIYFQGVKHLITKRNVQNRLRELVGIMFFLSWYAYLIFSFPTVLSGLAFFLITQAGNLYLHSLLAVNHFTQEKYSGLPLDMEYTLEDISKVGKHDDWANVATEDREEDMNSLEREMNARRPSPRVQASNFYITQLRTTMNLEYSSCFLYGGLHHQIEHHIYPFIPHYNLCYAAPLVKDICRRYDLPYRTVPDWTTGIYVLTRHLQDIALRAKDLSALSELFHTAG